MVTRSGAGHKARRVCRNVRIGPSSENNVLFSVFYTWIQASGKSILAVKRFTMYTRISFLLLILLGACRKTESPRTVSDRSLVSVEAINAKIFSQLDKEGRMEWTGWDSRTLWSAIAHADSVVAVGYQPLGFRAAPGWLTRIDLGSSVWLGAREQVLSLLKNSGATPHEVWRESSLPVLLVRLSSATVLRRLLGSPLIRYVEPMGYDRRLAGADMQVESASGCGSNTPTWDIFSGTHYTTLPPAAKQSWNYPGHGIPAAWGRCSGKGIKVFVIDTGSSWGQDNLGVSFNSGASYGRSLERLVTLPQNSFLGVPIGSPETSNDLCGHGTSMAGVVAAPRGSDGNAVGIAYNCDLITCRAAADVFLDESRELKGVVDAFTLAANRSDVRIISMSMGRITSSSYLADAIRFAYGKGKLIFSAAGTSFGWTSGWTGVIFPASLPEIQAVTGVKDLSTLTNCTICHKGPEVDFVVTMERNADGKHPLTLADGGDWPSTVGGSSVATASMAGMAALVWSKYPRLTRDQLLARLQQSGSLFPSKNSSYGWGRLDVDRATQ